MRDWPWYGYALLGLIILGLFYFVYFKPKNQELESLKQERIQVEEQVRELRAKKKELDKIEAELEAMNETLDKLEAIIPQRKEISDILRKIQQLAYDSRLNISKFVPQGLVEKEFYFEWPISVEITGNYHNLAIFFDRLSNFSRLFIIDNFSIRSLREQSEASTISATWTAKTFIFPEPSSEQEGEQNKGK